MRDNPFAFITFGVFEILILVFFVAAAWKIYTKAGKPGWAAIIPIYNAYVLLQIIGRPGWWLILYLIPIVNIVISVIVSIDLAKSFGRSTTFGVVMLFIFSFIGYAILGFGSSKYVGPAALAGAKPPSPVPEVPPQPQQPIPPPIPPTIA